MEKIVSWAAGGVTTAVLGWLAKSHDPFYSDGWFLNHPEWLPIPAIIALAAIAISLWNWGLVALVLLALAVAGIFGRLYGLADQSDQWPVITWTSHLIVLALAAGIIAGAARLFFVWWRGLPPPPPAPAPPP
jgi:hypothetical protein